MADQEELKKEEQTSSQDTSSPETSQGEKEEKELQDWWKEAQSRGFKKEEDVWKSYREAEKKISQMGDELQTYKKFEQQVSPVLEAIWNDESMLKRLKTVLGAQGETEQNVESKDQTTPSNAPVVDRDARGFLMQRVIDDFEKQKGIASLDEETKKDIRRKIGAEAGKWVGDLRKVPLDKFPVLLEAAFTVVSHKDEQVKKMLSDICSNRENAERAAMPSTSSAGSGSEEEITLTPEQRKVAERMPGGAEAYIRGLKKLRGYGVKS